MLLGWQEWQRRLSVHPSLQVRLAAVSDWCCLRVVKGQPGGLLNMSPGLTCGEEGHGILGQSRIQLLALTDEDGALPVPAGMTLQPAGHAPRPLTICAIRHAMSASTGPASVKLLHAVVG